MTLLARSGVAPAGAWIVSLLVLCGCGETARTELLVVVDSDLLPGEEITSVEVAAFDLMDPEGASTSTFAIRPPAGDEGETFPFSLSVVPGKGADLAVPVRVVVTGFEASGASVVRFVAVTRFRAGLSLRLPAPLGRDCAFEAHCLDLDAVCVAGECAEPEVDEQTLESVRPGRELTPIFDGPSPPADAGADSGVPDGGAPDGDVCVEGGRCAGEGRCDLGEQRCDPLECVVVGHVPEGTECGEGRVCDAEGRCGGS